MKSLIEKIRQQPPAVRSQVVFLIALVVSALVAVVWSTTLPAKFASIGETTDKLGEEKEGNAFGEIFSSAKDQLGSMGDAFKAVKDATVNKEQQMAAPETEEATGTSSESERERRDALEGFVATTTATETPSEVASQKTILIGTTSLQKVE